MNVDVTLSLSKGDIWRGRGWLYFFSGANEGNLHHRGHGGHRENLHRALPGEDFQKYNEAN
jgi:hypothetical protein